MRFALSWAIFCVAFFYFGAIFGSEINGLHASKKFCSVIALNERPSVSDSVAADRLFTVPNTASFQSFAWEMVVPNDGFTNFIKKRFGPLAKAVSFWLNIHGLVLPTFTLFDTFPILPKLDLKHSTLFSCLGCWKMPSFYWSMLMGRNLCQKPVNDNAFQECLFRGISNVEMYCSFQRFFAFCLISCDEHWVFIYTFGGSNACGYLLAIHFQILGIVLVKI